MSAKSDEIPYEKCVNTFFCISSKASFGKWSFLTQNLQKLAVPNETVRSKFKGKHRETLAWLWPWTSASKCVGSVNFTNSSIVANVLSSSLGRSMQRADLITSWVAKIGQVQRTKGPFSCAWWVFACAATIGNTRSMKRMNLLHGLC